VSRSTLLIIMFSIQFASSKCVLHFSLLMYGYRLARRYHVVIVTLARLTIDCPNQLDNSKTRWLLYWREVYRIGIIKLLTLTTIALAISMFPMRWGIAHIFHPVLLRFFFIIDGA